MKEKQYKSYFVKIFIFKKLKTETEVGECLKPAQGGESNHVLCCMQDKTSPIKSMEDNRRF